LIPGGQHFAMTWHKDYYAIHLKKLLESFKKATQDHRRYLERIYDSDRANTIIEKAVLEYQALLPLLPNIGDNQTNPRVVDFLPVAAQYVAYYRPMKILGASPEDVGKMFYDLYDDALERVPRDQAQTEGEQQFAEEHLSKLRNWAEWTQKMVYPANWVTTFVPGDGQTFDYGWDYTECAMIKYLRAYDVEELGPYMCPVDFPISLTYGTGLRRSGTLAYGDEVCDFRFSKGGPVEQNWDSELEIIKSCLRSQSGELQS
jgi:hypothetical protein